MKILPDAVDSLIESFSLLPGVGQKTAERYAYYLIKNQEIDVRKIIKSLSDIKSQIKICPKTFCLISVNDDISPIYTSKNRNKQIIIIVAEPFDIVSIENTGLFKGTYHVLGGLLSPLDNIGPDSLHIKELLQRIEEDQVSEIILALSSSVEGESTSLYLQKQILQKTNQIKITRLARGLPAGLDIEYADQITLSRALENRQVLDHELS